MQTSPFEESKPVRKKEISLSSFFEVLPLGYKNIKPALKGRQSGKKINRFRIIYKEKMALR